MIPALRKVLERMHYPLEVMLTCVRWYAAYPLVCIHGGHPAIDTSVASSLQTRR